MFTGALLALERAIVKPPNIIAHKKGFNFMRNLKLAHILVLVVPGPIQRKLYCQSHAFGT